MEFKVKEVNPVEEKGTQQVEKELLEKHEQQLEGGSVQETVQENQPEPVEDKKEEPSTELEINEERVLSFIKDKYQKEINSFEELLEERKESEELPEDVSAYFKFKKETGRSINDYVKLQRNFDDMPEDALLSEYFLATDEAIDAEDVDAIMDDYRYDEDLDDESDIKKAKLKKKRIVAKAKKFFNEQKETYKQPVESTREASSPEVDEKLKAYQQYLDNAKTVEETNLKKSEWFTSKTNEVFSSEFKGFEFKLGESDVTFNPGDAEELKKSNSTPMNFINKFMNEEGLMTDAAGYHKALSVAMNPDKFAKFFYEQGKSDAIEGDARKAKNINMTMRKAPETVSKGGMQIKALSNNSGRGLKIRSKK